MKVRRCMGVIVSAPVANSPIAVVRDSMPAAPMADSTRAKFAQLIFYVLILLIGYLAYLVISPFLAPLAWATVFAVMFYRVHVELSPRIGPSRSALAATLMTAVLIVAPAAVLVSVVAREAPQVIDYLQQ